VKQLPVGVKAPDFELETLDGRRFRLAEKLAGGPLVLAFFKSSCPTSQLAFPFLQKIHSEGPGRLRMTGVSQDEPDETREFVERYGITFDTLIDPHPYETSRAYGLEFVPAIFSVGPDGLIRLSDFGFSKVTLSELAAPLQLFRADDGLPATRPG